MTKNVLVSIYSTRCSCLVLITLKFSRHIFEKYSNIKYHRLFQITKLTHNSFIFQQYVCYTTLLNMFRAACCSKHVEERSVTYILLKNKRIVH